MPGTGRAYLGWNSEGVLCGVMGCFVVEWRTGQLDDDDEEEEEDLIYRGSPVNIESILYRQ